ncbi:hypothetical protein [Streptomyces peucetius]|uniref:Uncharacterized protein n=1 Tax=Streptomyces peucetius TaxID=1950 RepID=A0ABY6IGH7_STRPE|nr:hypothetical protein [Streptomyces peucetius]UYQ66119.1 hypothetical protein OGH68_34785 [Streptomyces peucetius]
MLITGENGKNPEPGTALLLAAAPAGKGRLIDAASVLPALAAVPADILAGTAGAASATVIELADPLDPQTVLTRIRAAAAAPGPLHLYLAGQLHVDRKQRLLHMALARTAPATLRYTGLPWHWLAGEIKARRPGSTTVVLDLVADAEAWRQVTGGHIGLGDGTRVYGRIAPASGRRRVAAPVHLKAVAGIWRSGARPALPELHGQAAAQAAAENGPDGALLFGVTTAGPAHTHAPHAQQAPHAQAHAQAPQTQAHIPGHTPAPLPVAVPVPGQVAVPAAADDAAPPRASGAEPAVPAEPAAVAPRAPGAEPPQAPAAGFAPGTQPPRSDPHPAILAAARAGRHAEAAAAAAARENEALRLHGPGSVQVLHWLEVRADLARLAQHPARSCELWMTAADVRLGRQQTADDPDVEAAVDRAHHQWEQIRDAARARRLAPALVALRRRVPGRQRGALRLLQRRLEQLHEERPGTLPAAPTR